MSLEAGRNLLHYRLIEQIGAGGMGVVWKAIDTDLDREVAIKVLPDAFSRDPERLARFQREAKLLAGQNHPNIATVYGLHEVGDVRFLAMELIAGQDLSIQLANGALPVERAVEIGRQIAEALEAAHENGIVHRDLKPANVIVTPDGQAKVLDFGLAKSAVEGGDPDISASPTMTSAGTQAGMILGTAAYLSPEQAKGNPVDRRTDIWAFGVVMHEMLSGERTFRGDGLSETLAAVILKEPDFEALPDETPPRLRELVRRCLIKDARKRLRDIGEARVTLEDPQAATVEGGPTNPPTAEAPAPPRRRWAWLALAAVPLVAIAAFFIGSSLEPEPPPAAPVRLNVEFSDTQRFSTTPGMSIVPSPDGTHVAFAMGEPPQLHVRNLQHLEDTVLSGTEGAQQPFFSPDGEWIGFFADNKLKKVSVHGGAPLTLAICSTARGGTWVPNGTIVYAPNTTTGLHRISAAGGEPEQITTLANDEGKRDRSHRWPHALPDGNSILFVVQDRGGRYSDASIELLDLDTLQHHEVHSGGSFPLYTPGGFLVFAREGTLFASRFDPARGTIERSPVPVLEGVEFRTSNGSAGVAFSRNGTLFYRSGGADVWLGQVGRITPDGVFSAWQIDSAKHRDAVLSPDERRVAYVVIGEDDGNSSIWTYDIERDVATRLTFAEAWEWYPSWTPDGEYVVFSSERTGEMQLYRKRADGTGDAESLTPTMSSAWGGGSFSPDGKHIVFHMRGDSDDLMVLDVTSEAEPTVFLSTDAREGFPGFSPDGKWIAYASDESGRPEIYVRPFPDEGGKWQISRDGAVHVEWARDGRKLYFEDLDGAIHEAKVSVDGSSFQVGRPAVAFKPDNDPLGRWTVGSDGSLVVTQRESTEQAVAERALVTVVFDWPTELERLVPR